MKNMKNMKNTSMQTTANTNPFKEVNMKHINYEQIYKLLQDNCIEYNNNSLGNKKFLLCKNCKKLNIEARKCIKCKFSFCFSCQKNHRCNHNNNNIKNMSINEEVINEIKKLKFRCMNESRKEMIFDEARAHYREYIQNSIKQLKQEGIKNQNKEGIKNQNKEGIKNQNKEGIKNQNKEGIKNQNKEGIKNQNQEGKKNKQEISISKQEFAKAGSSIPSSIQEESSKEQRTDDRLEENVRVSNNVKIYQKRENERGGINFNFFCCICSFICKDNKFCENDDNEEEKNCLEYLFKDKGENTSLILATIKSFLGILFSVIIIIISNLQLSFNDESLSESKKEAINKIIQPVKILSIVDLVLCLIGFLIGCVIFFCFNYKILGVICANLFDIIFGDITINILAAKRKKIIDYLENDSSKEIFQIIQDKLKLAQWTIFSIKMILLILIVIIILVLFFKKKKQ